MNIGELLGAMVQTGMSSSSNARLKNSLGGGSVLDSLSGMLGGASQKSGGGGIADALSGMLGGGSGGSGIGGALSGMLGGSGSAGGIGSVLSGMLGEAGQAVGGNKNLALGGLGALVGSLLGGSGKSLKGAVGGGLMAILGAMAFNALKASGQQKARVPLGLLEPQTDAERNELEQGSELVLKAMINATKADGQIDKNEISRIAGKLSETGLDAEGRDYLVAQMQKPMETEQLTAAAKNQPELAAQIYAASLLAIEVDTQAEKNYLDKLAAGLGLSSQVTARIREQVGLQSA